MTNGQWRLETRARWWHTRGMGKLVYVETTIFSFYLANASKFQHMRRVNTLLGLAVPALVTPLELMAKEEMP